MNEENTDTALAPRDQAGAVLARLIRYCSQRECCSGQILRRLEKTSLSETDQKDVLKALYEGRFVDDMRFAEIYCRDKALNARWGWIKIRRNLKGWGLDPFLDRAHQVWLELNPDHLGLTSLAAHKWRGIPNSLPVEKRCARLSRFLIGRGFAIKDVIEVVRPYFGKV